MSQAPSSGSVIPFDHHTLYPQSRHSYSPQTSVDLSSTPRVTPMSPHSGPSGLSVLMERGRKAAASGSSGSDSGETTPHASARSLDNETPIQGININLAPSSGRPDIRRTSHGSSHIHERTTYLAEVEEVPEDELGSSSELRQFLAGGEPLSERTPLLGGGKRWTAHEAFDFAAARNRLAKVTPADVMTACVTEPLRAMPAVILGLLLNVLDGVSYGMIL